MQQKKKQQKDIWKQLKEWKKDPEFVRAAYEFVRYHTGKSKYSFFFKSS